MPARSSSRFPREMTQAQGIELARDFVQAEFVDRGMIADLNVHWDMGEDGMPKPHAHVMLTMREVDENGFGQKVRDWNRTEMVERWRERWAEIADRFVERWQKLDHTSQRQYQAGDMSGYKATRSAMGDMAKSLERDPQLESILANRKQELGIAFESGRRLGQELAFTHGIDIGRGRGIGI